MSGSMRRLPVKILPGLGVAACIPLACLDSSSVLGGWLAAFAFWSSVPIGSLGLLMIMRLVPGSWRKQLSPCAEASSLTLPLAALAVLPVLAGQGALYGWPTAVARTAFREVFMQPWFFTVRTAVFFVASAIVGIFLIARPAVSTAVAAAGAIVFVPLDAAVAADWLMGLDPTFHSSGFGLYFLSVQMTIALSAIVIMRFRARTHETSAGVLGALLLSALLLWTYFAFMQYFVIWSGNLPQGVTWYLRRATGIWAAFAWAIAVLHLVPTALLLFAPIRRSGRWLIALAGAVLIGKAAETIWLVLPALHLKTADSILAIGLAFAGLGFLGGAVLAAAMPIAQSIRARADGRASP